jgi:hypothetical protein
VLVLVLEVAVDSALKPSDRSAYIAYIAAAKECLARMLLGVVIDRDHTQN